jgi:hypothetical protein
VIRIHPERELSLLAVLHREAGSILERDPAAAVHAEPCVSAWSPLEHVHHLALVSEACLEVAGKILLGESDPEVRGPTWVGRFILGTGWIPRGRARSPAPMVPPAGTGREAALAALARAGTRLEALRAMAHAVSESRARARHFLFGGLTAAQWIRVARVHTRHHLRIVADIERARRREPRAGAPEAP